MFKINKSKSINSLIYVIQQLKSKNIISDLHKVMKILYFADRQHLVNYGFPITGDVYLKMNYGPVPSFMNYVSKNEENSYLDIISKDGNILSTDENADLDDLSISELKCLDDSIDQYSNLTFTELTNISHSYAWNNSDWEIDYINMAIEGMADKNILQFIKQKEVNNKISFK